MITIIIVILVIAFLYYIYYLTHNNHEKSKEAQQEQQPIHFDLLDDNGDPMPQRQDEEPKVRMLEHFCIIDHGYHVTVWPKDYNQSEVVQFNIAGLMHRENIENYLGEFQGTLELEPTNAYDKNAIKVLAPDGHHVGYVSTAMTKEIRDNAQLPCTCFFYIGENNSVYFSECYIIRE